MNWNAVKSALPGQKITALPNIQDPSYLASAQTGLDGAFSWYAWPTDGGNSIIPGPMTTIWDERFIQNLAGRPYMARRSHIPRKDYLLSLKSGYPADFCLRVAVSPWFFTHFNTKNWVFICEEQPTIRWEQMLSLKPPLVEIVSWNGTYSLTSSLAEAI
jgi:glucan endo-1,3-alpha-glucosidase